MAAARGASRPFLRLGTSKGFTYTYDPSPAAGSTGSRACGSTACRSTRRTTYSVTVNSFLASGGDNFRRLHGGTGKQDTGKTDLQAMVDYMDEFASGADRRPWTTRSSCRRQASQPVLRRRTRRATT